MFALQKRICRMGSSSFLTSVEDGTQGARIECGACSIGIDRAVHDDGDFALQSCCKRMKSDDAPHFFVSSRPHFTSVPLSSRETM